MDERAWFISPEGTIYPVSRSHIAAVIADPALFGVTREYIEGVYRDNGERLGWEGRAREKIIKGLLERGWIRIRDYGGDYLSVQVFSLGEYNTADRLITFFEAIQFPLPTEIRLGTLRDGKSRSSTVADLQGAARDHGEHAQTIGKAIRRYLEWSKVSSSLVSSPWYSCSRSLDGVRSGLMLVGLIVLGYFNFGVVWIVFFAIWLRLGIFVEVCRLRSTSYRKIEKW